MIRSTPLLEASRQFVQEVGTSCVFPLAEFVREIEEASPDSVLGGRLAHDAVRSARQSTALLVAREISSEPAIFRALFNLQ